MAFSNHHFHSCFISVLLLCFRASPTLSRSLHDDHSHSDMTERHEKWMTQFGRVYENAAEKARRFEIFKSNVEYINNFNRVGNKTFELAVNEFADLTNEEFRTSRNGFKTGNARTAAVQPTSSSFKYENVTNLPSSMDWRRKGAVAPMKDQGRCGSCWAFSAVAAVEGITKIKTGKLFSLSEEQVIDCDSSDDGCMGGKIDGAYKYIRQHGGLTTGKNYPCIPYGIRHCNRKEAAMIVAKIKGYEDVPKDNEKALLKAVANQPVAVAIDASSDAFQFYSKGVFTGSCETDLDHGVTIVGYGKCKRTGKKYWLVKNSWGKSWGEKGYIRMERDVRSKHGLCGIAKMASYPIA